MRKLLLLALLLCANTLAHAQADADVKVVVGDTAYTIYKSVTQTGTKTPWRVFSFDVGGKTTKYLPGKLSNQPLDSPRPVFIIRLEGEVLLADFAIIKLRVKGDRRLLPEPLPRDNEYTPIDLQSFSIQPLDDERFAVQPLSPLPQGEYILLDLNQQPQGESSDYSGFCFTIE